MKTGPVILLWKIMHHQTYDFWKRLCAWLTKTSFVQRTTFGVISIIILLSMQDCLVLWDDQTTANMDPWYIIKAKQI